MNRIWIVGVIFAAMLSLSCTLTQQPTRPLPPRATPPAQLTPALSPSVPRPGVTMQPSPTPRSTSGTVQATPVPTPEVKVIATAAPTAVAKAPEKPQSKIPDPAMSSRGPDEPPAGQGQANVPPAQNVSFELARMRGTVWEQRDKFCAFAIFGARMAFENNSDHVHLTPSGSFASLRSLDRNRFIIHTNQDLLLEVVSYTESKMTLRAQGENCVYTRIS